ncbi:Rv3654c family TadE-like protein [Cellulomonas hominis]
MRSLRRGGPDRGSGSVLALALIAVLLVVALALGMVSGALSARGTAQTAADLAALAGAEAARSGVSACGRAKAAAARNGAALVECVAGDRGVVRVTTSRPSVLGTATARARAGPAGARR